MKIQSIELENYRQYRGKVIVDLSCDPNKNITVIQGVNGSGKTNMLNAVNWCLYGTEEYLSKYDTKKQPIINDAELRELPIGQRTRARVVLKMIDEKDNDRFYQFERIIWAKKDANGNIIFDRESEFHAYMQIGRDIKEIRETELLINRILPHGVKNFFFFDGERLDEFFKEESSERVRGAIFDVSQLYLLDRTIDHLEKTVSAIRGEIKGESPKVEEIQEKIRAIEGGLENSRLEKKEKEERLRQIRSKIAEIENKLKGCNESVVKALQTQRTNLENRLSEIEKQIEEKREQVVENILAIGPWIYCLPAVEIAIAQIDQKTEKGEIPPKIKQTFVKELLERGTCICGTNITTNNEAKQRLEELLKRVRISEIYEDILELKFALVPVRERIENFMEKQNSLRKEIHLLEQKKEEMKTQLQEISTRLAGVNVEEIANLEITRTQLKREEESLIRELGVLDQKIMNARMMLERLEKDLSDELKKSKKFEEINARLNLADDVLNSLMSIRQKLINDIRNTIEKRTQEYFLRLIWKKETYDAVKIDENYGISVINKLGSECLGTLSAGERQILALSFLAALREVSGFEAPIIIDTPLGRISKEHKEAIAELLPEFLKDAQVTLFMTDEEYTPRVRQILLRKVGKEYELCYDEARSQTRVKPYGQ
ncbi:MAG: AAA family ATPase [Nitrososphaerota archaeon]